CPTRWDSQGVSRDEAMSSGLVPITSRVAAIPEFVRGDTGFLLEPECPSGISKAILTLHDDPMLFAKMSETAATHIRATLALEQITKQELAVIKATGASNE